ncbi:DUF2842 domain-containing protein [Sphingomicrobium lutaoense]|uniref:Putative membrane channel-forming protein YqfA (Hemolysin III family) n=1 Tax=Sphingomicrobium lutaoense TaxID=515949 RepID=A0A839YZL7_9SPHN|nr:DUF2842 domain-containing protein [Sphingomicrobium lutaoense]MBB3763900.1 putative membrane channel-forming protein YqfA (hemolysin III family) [Sphingomicrobium lutaoense]
MARPKNRNLVGIFAILAWILLWVGAIAHFAPTIGTWPVLVQAVFYLVMGLVWILPLKRLLFWMEHGRFDPPRS